MNLDTCDVITILAGLSSTTADLIGGLRPEQWAGPTPCPEFDVHSIVEHLVSGLEQSTLVAEGKPADITAERAVAYADAVDAYRSAASSAVAAWDKPGRLDATFNMPWGTTTGRMLVEFLAVEQACHGWDIAKASRQDQAYADDDVRAVLDIAHAMVTDAFRVPGLFGPEVPAPPGARPVERLAAFLGRMP